MRNLEICWKTRSAISDLRSRRANGSMKSSYIEVSILLSETSLCFFNFVMPFKKKENLRNTWHVLYIHIHIIYTRTRKKHIRHISPSAFCIQFHYNLPFVSYLYWESLKTRARYTTSTPLLLKYKWNHKENRDEGFEKRSQVTVIGALYFPSPRGACQSRKRSN